MRTLCKGLEGRNPLIFFWLQRGTMITTNMLNSQEEVLVNYLNLFGFIQTILFSLFDFGLLSQDAFFFFVNLLI